jgi:hypothetical protein
MKILLANNNVLHPRTLLFSVNPDATIMRDGRSSYHILYDPDSSEQIEESSNGVSGQLIVRYDVSRDTDAGEIQVRDDHVTYLKCCILVG